MTVLHLSTLRDRNLPVLPFQDLQPIYCELQHLYKRWIVIKSPKIHSSLNVLINFKSNSKTFFSFIAFIEFLVVRQRNMETIFVLFFFLMYSIILKLDLKRTFTDYIVQPIIDNCDNFNRHLFYCFPRYCWNESLHSFNRNAKQR